MYLVQQKQAGTETFAFDLVLPGAGSRWKEPAKQIFGKVGNLAQSAWPPLPERWDFFREFVRNFRQKRGQICHKKNSEL